MTSFLSALAVETEKPRRMIVLGLDGAPLKDSDGSTYYVYVHSGDSALARRHDQRIRDRRIESLGRAQPSAAQIEADNVELLAALTAGWGRLASDGTEVPDPDFSPAVVTATYLDPAMVDLRDQVDRFAGRRANFAKASSTR